MGHERFISLRKESPTLTTNWWSEYILESLMGNVLEETKKDKGRVGYKQREREGHSTDIMC